MLYTQVSLEAVSIFCLFYGWKLYLLYLPTEGRDIKADGNVVYLQSRITGNHVSHQFCERI